jgi:hypothetical protein
MRINDLIEELEDIIIEHGDNFNIETFSNILFVTDDQGENIQEIEI